MSIHLLIYCNFPCTSYLISKTIRYFCSTQMEYCLVHHKKKVLYDQIINAEHHTHLECQMIIIIIITITIFINCKWVDTRWQWSFYTLHMHGL
jgi:hypothetical protein